MAGAVLLASCGGAPEGAATLEAAIVPGADLVIRVDVQALRSATLCGDAKAEEPAADGETPEKSEDPEFDGEHFLEVTGLTADDLLSVLVTADLDQVEVGSENADANLQKAVAVAGARLGRVLDLDTLEKGLRESARGDAPPAITRVDVGGTPALKIDAPNPEEPDVFVASVADGKTLLAAANQASLAGALERLSSGRLAAIAPELEVVHASLPAGAQARLGFVLPQKIRDGIAKQIDQPSPENAMAAGFAAPFKKIKSLSFGVEAAERLTVVLAADLGAEDAAQQAQGLLGGMLAPMARSALANALGKQAAEVEDRLAVTARGTAIDVTLRLTAEDVSAIRAKQAAAQAPTEGPAE